MVIVRVAARAFGIAGITCVCGLARGDRLLGGCVLKIAHGAFLDALASRGVLEGAGLAELAVIFGADGTVVLAL